MGFSSPAFAPGAAGSSRVVRVTSKHATPELPLLEGAASGLASLAELQLLPAAAIDAEGFGAEIFEDIAGFDSAPTPATAVPASPDNKSEDDEDDEEGDDDVEGESASGSSDENHVMAAVLRYFSKMDAVDTWEQSTRAAEQKAAEACITIPSMSTQQRADGRFIAMWCRISATPDSQLLVVTPLADGCVHPQAFGASEQDLASSYIAKLWCWAQPVDTEATALNGTGVAGMSIVPCSCVDQVKMPVLYYVDESQNGDCKPYIATASSEIFCSGHVLGASHQQSGVHPPRPADPCLTTLCITGLPDDMSQEDLLEVLDREELSGLYDFIFLPQTRPSQDGAPAEPRRALVNFLAPEHAAAAAALLSGRRRIGGRDAACQASWAGAVLQGLDALKQAFAGAPENAQDLDEELRPQLLDASGFARPLPCA